MNDANERYRTRQESVAQLTRKLQIGRYTLDKKIAECEENNQEIREGNMPPAKKV